jgi:hypothetical protein
VPTLPIDGSTITVNEMETILDFESREVINIQEKFGLK